MSLPAPPSSVQAKRCYDRLATMLDRLEELRRRFLALFGLMPDDPRRYIVASVIVYIAGAATIVMTLLSREPAEEPQPPPREIPEGVEPA